MKILDLKKDLKHLYNPSAREVAFIDVPAMNFLMIDGHGDPAVEQFFKDATQALYSLSYTLKFDVKKSMQIDYPVMALEGLWWANDMEAYTNMERSKWDWTLMILTPDLVTAEMVESARSQALKKKGLPVLEQVRWEAYAEGLSVQMMHIGPYAAEAPNIARMHQFIREQGCRPTGRHHEIYLSDPNRSAPEKMKTVLRQPVARQ